MRFRYRGPMLAGALALTLAVPGCAGDATAPPKPALSAPTRKLASALGYTEEGAITVYADGGVMRLDLVARTLTTPQGVTVTDIPGEEVARIASVFQHAVNDPAGQMEAALAANPPPPPEDGDGSEDCGGYPCQTYRVGPANDPPRGGSSSRTMSPGRRGAAGTRTPIRGPAFSGSPCGDIALQIYGGTQRWRRAWLETRSRMLTFAGSASQMLNRPIVTYEDVIRLAGSALLLELWMVEEMDSRFQLNFLAIQYGQFGCWRTNSNNWTPSDIGGVTSIGNSTTQYGWVCSTRLGVDDDGWPVPVETCEYMFAA